MTLALEPMITLRIPIRQLNDGWTIVTADGKAAAHYENSFAITDNGPLLLTVSDDELSVLSRFYQPVSEGMGVLSTKAAMPAGVHGSACCRQETRTGERQKPVSVQTKN